MGINILPQGRCRAIPFLGDVQFLLRRNRQVPRRAPLLGDVEREGASGAFELAFLTLCTSPATVPHPP